MSSGYRDELTRALEREDVAALRERLLRYHSYGKLSGTERAQLAKNFDVVKFIDLSLDDPDLGLAIVALAAAMFDDPQFLFLMAAGPLENILRFYRREVVDRVVAEARKNTRFRWMLTGVFLHAIAEEARPMIVSAIGTMTEFDPMPPRLA